MAISASDLSPGRRGGAATPPERASRLWMTDRLRRPMSLSQSRGPQSASTGSVRVLQCATEAHQAGLSTDMRTGPRRRRSIVAMSDGRPARQPRRGGGQGARGPQRSGPPRGPRAARGGRGSGEQRPESGRPPARGRRPERRPAKPPTAAQRRAALVAASRPPRRERDHDAERAKIEARTLDVWIDEGAADVRHEAAGAAARAGTTPRRRRDTKPLDPSIAAAVRSTSADRRRGDRLVEQPRRSPNGARP